MATSKERAFAAYDKAVAKGRSARDNMITAASRDLEQAKTKAFDILIEAIRQVREAYDAEIVRSHHEHAAAIAQAGATFHDTVAPARQALDEVMIEADDVVTKPAKSVRPAAPPTTPAAATEPAAAVGTPEPMSGGDNLGVADTDSAGPDSGDSGDLADDSPVVTGDDERADLDDRSLPGPAEVDGDPGPDEMSQPSANMW